MEELYLLMGGIRKGEPAYLGVTELSCTNYVFLDDSYYSGKTKSGIEEALKNIDSKAKITNTFVVYDGGIKFDKTVHSLFRYYNNAHDINL